MDQKILLDVHFKNHGSCEIYQHESFKMLKCSATTKPMDIYNAIGIAIRNYNEIYTVLDSIQINTWHLDKSSNGFISQPPYNISKEVISFATYYLRKSSQLWYLLLPKRL